MFKNVASQKLTVFAFDSTTNLPKTGDGANITAYVNKDYAGVNVLTDTSGTEMDATNAKGYYVFDLAQAETNGDTLVFTAKSTTANIVVIGDPAVVFTSPPNFTSTSISGAGKVAATLASTDVTGNVAADLQTIKTQTITCAAGVTVSPFVGNATAALGVDASGRIDLGKILGTAVSAPATAGILDVNVKNMNNVAATSITTINANQGTTQPINFTGTGASALAKSDMVDIAGAAVSATTAQLGVNLVNIAGSAVATGTAQLGVNLVNITGSAVSTSSAQLGVNVANLGGSATPVTEIGNAFSYAAGTAAAFGIADMGTAQAATGTTLQLRAAAAFADSELVGATVYIRSATTGAGQSRTITANVGSTDTVTVDTWTTTPTGTITYIIFQAPKPSATLLVAANVTQVDGAALGTHASGMFPGDLRDIAGSAVNTSTAQLGVNIVNASGSAVTLDTNNALNVSAKYLAGTALTGRDIGSSVLLSAGTATGQLDFTSGVVKANLVQILATALTETAGQIAAAFKQFFNIASPTSTMNAITAVTTVTTTTTATNLTNAPTAGDFTAAMKTSLNAATPASVAGAVGSVTGNVGGNVVGSVGSVTGTVTTDVTQTTRAEPGLGARAATATVASKIDYLFKAWRNKKTQTASVVSLFADDATTVDQKGTVSDDGTTLTTGEIGAGP